jgi:hypothetical protein
LQQLFVILNHFFNLTLCAGLNFSIIVALIDVVDPRVIIVKNFRLLRRKAVVDLLSKISRDY